MTDDQDSDAVSSLSRRRFLELTGISSATGAAGCASLTAPDPVLNSTSNLVAANAEDYTHYEASSFKFDRAEITNRPALVIVGGDTKDERGVVEVTENTDRRIAELSGGSGSYGDEDAQDAVGTILGSSFTYDDATPAISVAADGITTSEIAADAITNALIAADAVDSPQLAANAVVRAAIASGAVGSTELDTEETQDLVGGMAGSNLTYDDTNNELDASGGGDPVDVQEGGTDVVTDAADLNFAGSDFNVSNPSTGVAKVASAGGGGGLGWQEDGNSPINETKVTSTSITLSGTYDEIKVKVQTVTNNGSNLHDFSVRLNGDTGANYSHYDMDTETTGVSEIPVGRNMDAGASGSLTFHVTDAWPSGLAVEGPTGDGTQYQIIGGHNTSITAPLDSMAFRMGGASFDLQARVYGWNGGI